MTHFDETQHPREATGTGKFATKSRSEADVNLDPATRADTYGGFRLTKVRTMEGREGLAFSATLTENGKPVADVIQDGNGGVTTVRWHGRWRTDATDRFEEVAASVAAGAYEPDEELIGRLMSVDEMNRKRSVAFIFDGDDFWSEGEYRAAPAKARLEDVLAELSKPAYRSRNPRVWDKDAGDFIPLDEAIAKS